ncbi:BrnT family toxin [Kozakia baliensis]|uniref:BrnT family toxin n=1 Tax=Kozakia baliensis TaxID=153496 RepID=UPI0004974FBA|nr:BrnT family toxin [Kozakia baliensis]
MLVITWDEPKRLKTLRERGLDFADLTEGYFLLSLVVPAKNDRMMAIGPFIDGTVSVVFLALGNEGISIISMRPASAKERKRYEEAQIA